MAKILVADDNSNIQKMVGLALKDQGIDVVAVGNGEAAVRKISDIHPDLVLADVFMPVRNGYEVCKYVKDDPALAHIPVILLVGAFDPLDEQEAQRVGADGVLKKPFVPPDPLISMVKSALLRAGVPLGNAPAVAGKPNETPTRKAAEVLGSAAASKHAAISPEKLPEAMPEPAMEDFHTRPEHLKIAAGEGPVAFGSMLETPEVEDDAAFMPPGKGGIAAEHNWGSDVEEEEEEELEAAEEKNSSRGGWRPGGLSDLDDAALPTRTAHDWREQAFHGNSPAKNAPAQDRPQSANQIQVAEAAEAQTVAVSTLETAPADAPVPFTGDAWAAAMAAGLEQKLGEAAPAPTETPATETTDSPAHEETQSYASSAAESAPVADNSSEGEIKLPERSSDWPSASTTPWELEAQKASLLASTWDAPARKSPDETQEMPPYVAAPLEEHTEAAPEPEAVSAYAAEAIVETTEHVETATSEVREPEAQEPEVHQPEVAEHQETKSSENAWEAPAPLPVGEHAPPATIEAIVEEVVAVPAGQLNMDELVARVLEKMNPDVLQRVTREILKPVIEAIVRDELNSKKS